MLELNMRLGRSFLGRNSEPLYFTFKDQHPNLFSSTYLNQNGITETLPMADMSTQVSTFEKQSFFECGMTTSPK